MTRSFAVHITPARLRAHSATPRRYVVGLQSLMAWSSELAMEAVELFHRVRCMAWVAWGRRPACLHHVPPHSASTRRAPRAESPFL